MVEGDTEVLFYKRVKTQFHGDAQSGIINLQGNWNINKKILAAAEDFQCEHPDRKFRIFIAIDKESRYGLAQVDITLLKSELMSSNIGAMDVALFEATQDIESWFFHDIEGIFKFLRVPRSKRIPSKYKPVEKLNHTDLSRLFKSAGKTYKKGFASRNFIDHLDIDLIKQNCEVLQNYCKKMKP